MTRRSKRELERAVESISPTDEAPLEIVITHHEASTGWGPDDVDADAGAEGRPVSQLRAWRDDVGEWHSERTTLTADGGQQ